MSCIVYWFWIICKFLSSSVQPVSSNVSWEVETRIIRIGETVVLTCTVHDVTDIDPEQTRQWFKGSSLVCYNGKPTNPWKYIESLNRNKFQLHIYNVTEEDLNCEYRCLYSFDTYAKELKTTAENFENPPSTNTTDLHYHYDTINGILHVELYMKKIFPLPNCTVLLEVLQLEFADCAYTENGLYFDVHLEHKSNILLEANTQFNVTCQLLEVHFIAERLIRVSKGENPIIPDEWLKQNIAAIVLIPLILVYLIICVAMIADYCKDRRRKKKQKSKDVILPK